MVAEKVEGEAYARLIAAAPEMLEAIKRFVDYYAGSKKSHLGNGQAYKSHSEMEALLAKIKGGMTCHTTKS